MKSTFLMISLLTILLLPACSVIVSSSGDAPSLPQETPEWSDMPAVELPPVSVADEPLFTLALAAALEERDFDRLQGLMGSRFSLAYIGSGLIEVSSEEALVQMRQIHLVPGSQPAVDLEADLLRLFDGVDPLGEFGPTVSLVRGVYVSGLGSSAAGEALAVIAQDPASGALYFHGLLLPQLDQFSQPVYSGVVNEAGFAQASVKVDTPVRSGPGEEYPQAGLVRGGEVAEVTGISPDGDWVRIFCTSLPSRQCWLPASSDVIERQ